MKMLKRNRLNTLENERAKIVKMIVKESNEHKIDYLKKNLEFIEKEIQSYRKVLESKS